MADLDGIKITDDLRNCNKLLEVPSVNRAFDVQTELALNHEPAIMAYESATK